MQSETTIQWQQGLTPAFQQAIIFLYPNREPLDFTKTHRKRSNRLRSAEKSSEAIRHQEWYAAKQIREARIRQECCQQIRDVAGNPFQPVNFRPEWLTSTVVAIAQGIDAEQAYDRMPILADEIQDAGCENGQILTHCRSMDLHVKGCWIIDSLLGIM